MAVVELLSYTPQELTDLDALMLELSTTSFCNEELLNNALNDANVHVYVIRNEGRIILKSEVRRLMSEIKRGERYGTNCYKRVIK